jgi:hypothetical protein
MRPFPFPGIIDGRMIHFTHCMAAACLLFPLAALAGGHKNFKVAVYIRSQEVREMKDLEWLKARWAAIEGQIKVDKVYIETMRDWKTPDRETILQAKQFFASKGIETAGGVATVVDERAGFRSLCYSDPAQRAKLRELVEYTAGLFDEIILDDFFFTNCKCDLCIRAKGNRSWTQFRLDQMAEVSRDVVIGPARAVNPKVKMVIKYPNWYDHYQYLGYNLEAEPKLFDGIYTGTETRDPVYTLQHLQPYQGYAIMRYLENVKPGGNGGGWVDPFSRRTLDRYAEQLWLTLFAKAREITLFDFRQMIDTAPAGSDVPASAPAHVAGYVFDQVDRFLGKLGRPVGVASYKPYHSSGEDFLHNFIGMLGIPIELQPEFPAGAKTIFLAESAKFDAGIVGKVKTELVAGHDVVITSGLLKALQGKGIEDIAELEYTDHKAATREYSNGWRVMPGDAEIAIPEIRYPTNDSWEIVSGLSEGVGYPVLLRSAYSKGALYVLTIPENFGDLYNLPPEALAALRGVLAKDLFVRIEAPSQVSLFVYDNDTFIVESFVPHLTVARVVAEKRITKLRDLVTGAEVAGQPRGEQMVFDVPLAPHSYRAFAAE